MPIEIKYTSQLISPWLHWFFMGATGSGKTTIAGSFPFPLFIVPKNEQSVVALRGGAIDFPYIEVASSFEMNDALSMLETAQRQSKALAAQAVAAAQGGPPDFSAAWQAFPYQTIVCESFTHYGDLLIEDLTSEEGEIGIHNAIVKASKGDSSLHKMDQQKWGLFGAHIRNIHARLRNLPVHVVFTALTQIKENEKSKVTTAGAMINGMMATKLPSACDAIGYCEVIPGPKPIYRTHFTKYKLFEARMRTPRGVASPAYIDDFTWAVGSRYFGNYGT